MEVRNKVLYEAPRADVVELFSDAIMQQASKTGYGDSFELD
jgi:hypothetical protein